jgi:hypothetical protein
MHSCNKIYKCEQQANISSVQFSVLKLMWFKLGLFSLSLHGHGPWYSCDLILFLEIESKIITYAWELFLFIFLYILQQIPFLILKYVTTSC